MVNGQYHFKQFSLGGGISIGEVTLILNQPHKTIKPLKHYPIRFFFNYSKMKRTLGVACFHYL